MVHCAALPVSGLVLSAPAQRRGTGRRPVEGAAAQTLAACRRHVIVGMVVIMIVMMIMAMMVMMMPTPMIMTVAMSVLMVMIVVMVMDALARARAARVFVEDQRLDGHRHRVGRHADAAEVDVIEV